MSFQLHKSIIAILFCLEISFSSLALAATYGGGSGTESDPYQIWTPEQMNTIGANPSDWGKHFKLMTDIDMSIYTGTQYRIIGSLTKKFTGTFEGNGHIISNLTYTQTAQDHNVGLFGYVSDTTIQNLGLENVNITGQSSVGGLVGAGSGSLINCYSTGSVTGKSNIAGGLVGSFSGTLTNCYSTVLVTSWGSYWVGGLVGTGSGSVTNCYATGSVIGGVSVGGSMGEGSASVTNCYATGSVLGATNEGIVGGLLGSGSGSVTNCYATGSVSGVLYVGGLVGLYHSNFLTACYATGEVVGEYCVGGLVGQSSSCTLTTCYATGSVTGGISIGGLIGDNHDTSITTCFSTCSVSGTQSVGGLVGSNDFYSMFTTCFWDIQTSGLTNGVGYQGPDPSGLIGKTTSEMQALSTFTDVGWDFADTDGDPEDWWMVNNDYPHLAWERPTLLAPNGRQTLMAGQRIPIEWTRHGQ